MQKASARTTNQPKEECVDYHVQQQQHQPKEMLARSDSERSLMDDGSPVTSCDHQPLHTNKNDLPESAKQPGKLHNKEASQDCVKPDSHVAPVDTAVTMKKQILDEANKSMCY